ncbi:STAS domain-containing protein [Rhodanobacter sp. B04]|uniref:STAS domain-containing protein n=1 Tax=Rhodanobacter sp. B04 TaxID=1945860 RepID=UPI0009875088|nr:STAS domain-containing protein [Rhodanobacter sp. B04]
MTLSLHSEFPAPDRVIVQVGGRLDAMTFGELDEAMLALLRQLDDGGTVVIDLAGLEYVSSAGLRSFAQIRKRMRARGGYTLLLNPQPQVRKVFEIVKAVPVNEVFTSTQELDAYLDRMQRRIIEGDSDA